MINAVYLPISQRAYWYARTATILMLGGLVVFIIMGMAGGTQEIRGVVNPLSLASFFVGLCSMAYSRWIEQPAIRKAAVALKAKLDNEVNPRYLDSEWRITWTISVNAQKKAALHMGKKFVERPIVTIWARVSEDEQGRRAEYPLPEQYTHGILMEHSSDGPKKVLDDLEGW